MEQGAGCYEVSTGKEPTTTRSHWYGEWWVVHLLSNLGWPLTDVYMCKTKFLSLPLTMWIFLYVEDRFLARLFGFWGAFLYAICSRWSLPVVYAGWVEPVFSNCHQSTLTPSFPSSMDKASYFVLRNLQGYVRSNVVIDFEGLFSQCKLNDITWTIIGSQSWSWAFSAI